MDPLCPCYALWKFSDYIYTVGLKASVDMDISMDIRAIICGYGYGYGWEISYPRQAWLIHF